MMADFFLALPPETKTWLLFYPASYLSNKFTTSKACAHSKLVDQVDSVFFFIQAENNNLEEKTYHIHLKSQFSKDISLLFTEFHLYFVYGHFQCDSLFLHFFTH